MLARQGRLDEAVEHYHRALKIRPNHANARNNLRKVSAEQARLAETLEEYRKALENKPDDVAAANNLAWLLATCPSASLRNGTEAIEIARLPVGLPAATNPPCSTRWPRHTPKRADFPKRSPRPQSLGVGRSTKQTGLADGLRAGSPCTKRESRFVRRRWHLQRRRRNRDRISKQKNPAARGEAKRRGRNREEADSLIIAILQTMSIVWPRNREKYSHHPRRLPSLGVILTHFARFEPSAIAPYRLQGRRLH